MSVDTGIFGEMMSVADLALRCVRHSREQKSSPSTFGRDVTMRLARADRHRAGRAVVDRPSNDEPFTIRLARRQRDVSFAASGTEGAVG